MDHTALLNVVSACIDKMNHTSGLIYMKELGKLSLFCIGQSAEILV